MDGTDVWGDRRLGRGDRQGSYVCELCTVQRVNIKLVIVGNSVCSSVDFKAFILVH